MKSGVCLYILQLALRVSLSLTAVVSLLSPLQVVAKPASRAYPNKPAAEPQGPALSVRSTVLDLYGSKVHTFNGTVRVAPRSDGPAQAQRLKLPDPFEMSVVRDDSGSPILTVGDTRSDLVGGSIRALVITNPTKQPESSLRSYLVGQVTGVQANSTQVIEVDLRKLGKACMYVFMSLGDASGTIFRNTVIRVTVDCSQPHLSPENFENVSTCPDCLHQAGGSAEPSVCEERLAAVEVECDKLIARLLEGKSITSPSATRTVLCNALNHDWAFTHLYPNASGVYPVSSIKNNFIRDFMALIYRETLGPSDSDSDSEIIDSKSADLLALHYRATLGPSDSDSDSKAIEPETADSKPVAAATTSVDDSALVEPDSKTVASILPQPDLAAFGVAYVPTNPAPGAPSRLSRREARIPTRQRANADSLSGKHMAMRHQLFMQVIHTADGKAELMPSHDELTLPEVLAFGNRPGSPQRSVAACVALFFKHAAISVEDASKWAEDRTIEPQLAIHVEGIVKPIHNGAQVTVFVPSTEEVDDYKNAWTKAGGDTAFLKVKFIQSIFNEIAIVFVMHLNNGLKVIHFNPDAHTHLTSAPSRAMDISFDTGDRDKPYINRVTDLSVGDVFTLRTGLPRSVVMRVAKMDTPLVVQIARRAHQMIMDSA
jgi:hypothetical protein